jgi:hypothetical protein
MSFWSNIKARFFGVAVAEDEALNAALGPDKKIPAAGNAHFTVSQRLAEMRQRGEKIGCIGCAILTFLFKPFNLNVKNYDHCQQAMSKFPEDLPTGG